MPRYKIFSSQTEFYEFLPKDTIKGAEVMEKPICFIRNSSGTFALADRCPHAGAKFSEGHCNHLGEIVCPLHSYIFDLKSGNEVSNHGYNLHKYNLEITEDGVYLEL